MHEPHGQWQALIGSWRVLNGRSQIPDLYQKEMKQGVYVLTMYWNLCIALMVLDSYVSGNKDNRMNCIDFLLMNGTGKV